MLLEARQTMEQSKTAELENYFQDDCVAALQATAKSVDEISEKAAAIYPILLEDRVELLVSLPGRMLRVVCDTDTLTLGVAPINAVTKLVLPAPEGAETV